ncbi:MAG: SGNH/GDSL hydrolase family protein [Crocinitomicaceae bacterium]|nr:SGNH/GDSL hydrolase family protein [Crocinitomicaceae bacterium]
MEALKKRLINISVAVLVSLVMLLLCEFVIRMLYKDSMVLFPRYQTDVKYGDITIRQIRPDMTYVHSSVDGEFDFISNNRGFRNEENIDYSKGENEIRILCLGDSHTLGYEVKQSQVFTTVIEDSYNGSHDLKKITAINTGVSGTGTAEQLAFFTNEGFNYDPDFVVLGFCNNDFRNNQICKLYKVENDSLIVDHLTYAPGTGIQNFIYQFRTVEFLGENSYLYALAFNTIWNAVKKARYADAGEEKKDELTEYVTESRNEFSEYDALLMTKLLEKMYDYCQEINAPLIILDIPKTDLSSSIPEDLVDVFRANSDTLFYAPDLNDDFSGLAKVHVKNGHRHISEETHSLFANKILNFIDDYNKQH